MFPSFQRAIQRISGRQPPNARIDSTSVGDSTIVQWNQQEFGLQNDVPEDPDYDRVAPMRETLQSPGGSTKRGKRMIAGLLSSVMGSRNANSAVRRPATAVLRGQSATEFDNSGDLEKGKQCAVSDRMVRSASDATAIDFSEEK